MKLIYYIKTIDYYNSDFKIEMYAKNYSYKVRSNNESMCHKIFANNHSGSLFTNNKTSRYAHMQSLFL